jgi:hypothetical protein
MRSQALSSMTPQARDRFAAGKQVPEMERCAPVQANRFASG